MKSRLIIILTFVLTFGEVYSQNDVVVYPNIKRYIGDVTNLQRNKFFNIHTTSDSDPDINSFLTKYDVGLGRGFWGPFSYSYGRTKTVGVYPDKKSNSNTKQRPIKRYIATEHCNNQIIQWGMDVKKAAEWAVEYYNNFSGNNVPEFFEPMNEPFVHAGESQFTAPSTDAMKQLIADYYSEIGKSIHANPYLKGMKVIGYASAYPSMEIKDFTHWKENMKMFIDRAGANMDGISVHLYDGINVRGKKSRRSGSNSEAILDLVEAYSYIKFGKILPHATSEYGGIDDTYGLSYDEIASSRTVSSFNHILFNLLSRENNMLISIPFVSDKAEWYITAANNYDSYGAVLFLPQDPKNLKTTKWTVNSKVHFFDLWKDVKGERVDITTDNPDIQVQAFKNSNTLYVAIDNLDDYSQEVNLKNISGWNNVSSVMLRSLKVRYDTGIDYSEKAYSTVPDKISLEKDETDMFVISLNNSSDDNTIRSTKYYSNTYLQPITSGKKITFNFSGVKSGFGRAVARMSIGRKLTMSKKPIVSINGVSVEMPDNWKGYDQEGRDDFFGMIEIPFDISILKDGNNSVSVTFPDNGGTVSSMILQVDRYDNKPSIYKSYVINGGFESSNMIGWNPWSNWGDIEIDNENAYEGSSAVKITGKAGVTQTLKLNKNQDYVLKVYIKTSANSQVVFQLDSNGQEIKNVPMSSSSLYQCKEISFNTGDNEIVRFSIGVKGEGEVAWIDEVSCNIK